MKAKKIIAPLLCVLLLNSCNLYGGINKPSGDAQLISAARAALDQGDYVKAKEYYQAISDDQIDIRVSELALNSLAEIGVFSISDLIQSLGSSRGSAKSITSMATVIYARGKTDASLRTTIQATYSGLSAIKNTSLRSFIQFLTSVAMINQILASAVGADGLLTVSDIASTSCSTVNCINPTVCDKPTGSLFLDNGVVSEPSSMSSASNWNTSPSIKKLELALTAASTAASSLGISGLSGIGNAIDLINSSFASAPGGSEPTISHCKRAALINSIF